MQDMTARAAESAAYESPTSLDPTPGGEGREEQGRETAPGARGTEQGKTPPSAGQDMPQGGTVTGGVAHSLMAETVGRTDAQSLSAEENGVAQATVSGEVGHTQAAEAAEGTDSQGMSEGSSAEEPTPSAESDRQADTDYGELIRRDTEELRRLVPACSNLGSVLELDDPLRYAALRDLGLTPSEAYYATKRRESRAPSYDNRSHLHPSVGKMAGGGGGMSAGELRAARTLFGNLSDAAIQSLYRRATETGR